MNPAIVTLLESDLPKLLFSGFLSKRTSFSVRIDGPFGEREAANLRRMVEAHIAAAMDEGSPPEQGSAAGAVPEALRAFDGAEATRPDSKDSPSGSRVRAVAERTQAPAGNHDTGGAKGLQSATAEAAVEPHQFQVCLRMAICERCGKFADNAIHAASEPAPATRRDVTDTFVVGSIGDGVDGAGVGGREPVGWQYRFNSHGQVGEWQPIDGATAKRLQESNPHLEVRALYTAAQVPLDHSERLTDAQLALIAAHLSARLRGFEQLHAGIPEIEKEKESLRPLLTAIAEARDALSPKEARPTRQDVSELTKAPVPPLLSEPITGNSECFPSEPRKYGPGSTPRPLGGIPVADGG